MIVAVVEVFLDRVASVAGVRGDAAQLLLGVVYNTKRPEIHGIS